MGRLVLDLSCISHTRIKETACVCACVCFFFPQQSSHRMLKNLYHNASFDWAQSHPAGLEPSVDLRRANPLIEEQSGVIRWNG